MTAENLNPGAYTLRWQVSVRTPPRTPFLRLSQLAAFAVQPRFGELQGNSPQPTDAEAIINPIAQDQLTGVVRVRLSRAVPTRELGAAILAAIRSVEPSAVPVMGSSVAGTPAALAVPFVRAPVVALAGLLRASPSLDRSVSERFGNVIVEARPGIDNTARPLAATGPLSGLLLAGSTRQSADPAREGQLAGQAAREAAQAVAEATTLSTGAIVAIVAASTAVVALVGYVVYRRTIG